MQHLDNNMDDLFRRAAEGYPLNTGSADWEKVSAMLKQKEEGPQSPENRNPFWLLLLLLLPLALICNRLSDGVIYPEVQASGSSSHSIVSLKSPHLENETDLSAGRNWPIASSGRIHQPVKRKDPFLLPAGFSKKPGISLPVAAKDPAVVLSSVFEQRHFSKSAEQNNKPATIDETILFQSIDKAKATKEDNLIIENSSIPATTAAVGADTVENGNELSPLPEQKTLARKQRFFVSLVAGPGITTVKFQQFSEVGLQAGVLFGYRINSRFAVEAGVFSGRKHYKSNGEYFNKSKLYLPPNTEVVAVNGNCRMLELPVIVRYSFREEKKRTFFASAGFSSYLMQSEDYKYNYLYTASGYVATYRKTYKDQTRNWLSVFQLTGGVFYPLGKVGHLRVEPYYALPLNGIGYGEMPLSSFGIRLGLMSNRF